jgi:hypothetical protein
VQVGNGRYTYVIGGFTLALSPIIKIATSAPRSDAHCPVEHHVTFARIHFQLLQFACGIQHREEGLLGDQDAKVLVSNRGCVQRAMRMSYFMRTIS